ncbi:MAG: hypothetical protein ACM3PF_01630 [Bacteroidota bacterium]
MYHPGVARDDLLDHLVGSWTLTGRRGSEELRQDVTGEWTLQDQYVRMHFRETRAPEGKSPYEALYMLGYDPGDGTYVLHLFDRFGAAYSRVLGVGTRRGDSIEFLFEYPDGEFSNTFTWQSERGCWEMLLRERTEAGEWRLWATKTLAPRI